MKQRLVANAELDLLTADELRTLLQEYASGWLRPPQTIRPSGTIALDASGDSSPAVGGDANVGDAVYMVPAGLRFRLHRIGIFPDGVVFGTPFTAANGYVEIQRGDRAIDGFGFQVGSAGLPRVLTWGKDDAPEYAGNEKIGVLINAGPANTNVRVHLQGTLEAPIDFSAVIEHDQPAGPTS